MTNEECRMREGLHSGAMVEVTNFEGKVMRNEELGMRSENIA